MADLLIGTIASIVNKFIPDGEESAKRALTEELTKAAQTHEIYMAQAKINEVEAASENLFKSGARPFILWVCGIAFTWQFVLEPIVIFIMTASGHPIDLPKFDYSSLNTLLFGMLGLGGMRTYEKLNKRK